MAAQAHTYNTIPAQCICVVVLHTTGNNGLLAETMASIEKQAYPADAVIVHVVQQAVDALPQMLYKVLDESNADLYVLMQSGDTFFDSTFHSVNDIFNSINNVEWLTGIETVSTVGGYKVVHGNTATRRWSGHILRKNLYECGERYIPAAATFWRRSLWNKAKHKLNFVSAGNVHTDLWQAFMPYAKVHPCDVYFSSVAVVRKPLALNNYNAPEPIEKKRLSRLSEYFYLNNIPYLRGLYRMNNKLPQIIRFNHKTRSYFLSDY